MPAKQVLIVEDERPIREMIAFGLKRAGFEVREAEDCRSARASVADRRPDLLLVDWMLPDMSGLELTRSLKRDRETRELPDDHADGARRGNRQGSGARGRRRRLRYEAFLAARAARAHQCSTAPIVDPCGR